MRFTTHQYNQAIQALESAKTQIHPDGNPCAICGDTGHQAFSCGMNPLVAVSICRMLATESYALHETLHYLAGFDQQFGEQVGPAKVIVPEVAERNHGAFYEAEIEKAAHA